jgi:hypothetical protein
VRVHCYMHDNAPAPNTLESRVLKFYRKGDETVAGAVLRNYGGDGVAGDHFGKTRRITFSHKDGFFAFVGGRGSLARFLLSGDNRAYRFEAGPGEKLRLITARKQDLLGKNKTMVIVCTNRLLSTDRKESIFQYEGKEGVPPLDPSEKALTCEQLGQIVTAIYAR